MALLFRAFDVKNIIFRFYIIFSCIVTISKQGKVCVCNIFCIVPEFSFIFGLRIRLQLGNGNRYQCHTKVLVPSWDILRMYLCS